MKYNLLEMTQAILSSMDADEVTDIDGTLESSQVAKVIRTAYYDLVSPTDLPEHFGLFTLTASSISTPTVLTRPSDVNLVKWLKYNKRLVTDTVDVWGELTYLDPETFMDMSRGLDQTATTVEDFTLTTDSYSTTVYVQNDKPPDYWTAFDDEKIVCDSYDVSVEAYLAAAKTSGYGKLSRVFTLSNSFTPDLDEQQFSLLLNEAKSLAFLELKQMQHPKAEKKVRQGLIHLERKKQDLPAKDRTWKTTLPDYGRR